MPKFLEQKLKKQYGGGKKGAHAVYGTLNKIGAMRGNKETAKGRAMEKKHKRDVKAGKASGMPMQRGKGMRGKKGGKASKPSKDRF